MRLFKCQTEVLLIIAVALFLSQAVVGYGPVPPTEADPRKECSRRDVQVFESDNKVYTYGGKSWMNNDSDSRVTNHYLRIFDFTTARDLNDSSILTIKDIPGNITIAQYGAFWVDSKRVYTVGGDVNFEGWLARDGNIYRTNFTADATGRTISSYNLETEEWAIETAIQPSDGASVQGSFCCGSFAYNAPARKAYMYSGLTGNPEDNYDPFSSPIFTNAESGADFSDSSNLLTFNANTFTWNNVSLDEKTITSGSTATVGGQFAFLPSTKSADGGVGVLIGGRRRQSIVGNTWGEMESMREVLVFDAATGDWYRQPTTADDDNYPNGRWTFCMVAASAPDNSSHNIYMYGGEFEGEVTSEPRSDMWILTVPAFHWLRVNVDSQPRKAHSCTTVGQRYMLSYGGTRAGGQSGDALPTCDDENHGLQLFDLSKLSWTTRYGGPPTAGKSSYTVPKIVFDAIGGNEQGKATKTAPSAGFAATGLAALFGDFPASSTATTPAASESSETSPENSQTSDPDPPKKSDVGAIAGGVLGGLAGMALVLTGVLLLLRRKRQQDQVGKEDSPSYELHNEQTPGELPDKWVAHQIYGSQECLAHELPALPQELPATRNG